MHKPPTVENWPKDSSDATLRPFSNVVTLVSYETASRGAVGEMGGRVATLGNGSLRGTPVDSLE